MKPWVRGQPPLHVDRPRPWGTAGPPRHCRREGTTGKAVSLCTKCWEGDNQYFCTGMLPCPEPARLRARNPVQLPPVTWWQDAENGRDHRSVCTFSPTHPWAAGSYRRGEEIH